MNKALSLTIAAIWLAIGALTWFLAEPRVYATPLNFVVNLLIRPQLAAVAAFGMLASARLMLDMLINPYQDHNGLIFCVVAACAYCLAGLCGLLLPFPGMNEALLKYIGMFFVCVMLFPIFVLVPPLLIFGIYIVAPLMIFHYLIDRLINKKWWPTTQRVPSVYDHLS